MEYEGIYRKTGGAGQSKAITHAFERGDYESFDLRDVDAFNDISSVTSVLKTYFRKLPNPLLTFELHESFVQAACRSASLYEFPVLTPSGSLSRYRCEEECTNADPPATAPRALRNSASPHVASPWVSLKLMPLN